MVGNTDRVRGAEAKTFATPRQNGRGGKESGRVPTQGLRERVERSHFLHRMTYGRTWWFWPAPTKLRTCAMLSGFRPVAEAGLVLVIPKEKHCDTTVSCRLRSCPG